MIVLKCAIVRRIGAALAVFSLAASCGGGGGDAPATPTAAAVTLFAGSLQTLGSRDGVNAAAQFNGPADVAQDRAGNVYVADAGNHMIRKIAVDGSVTTLAGATRQPGSADGAGVSARFSAPGGVAVDGAGNVYVSDAGNHTVRRISAAGVVTTFAGAAGQPGNVDGPVASARFSSPKSIAVDGAGNVYLVDATAVRKVSPDGNVSTFTAKPDQFAAVAVDGAGSVYLAASRFPSGGLGIAGTVRKFDSQGQPLPFGPNANGVLMANYPVDIDVDAAGNVYLALNGFFQPVPSFLTTYQSIERITPDGMTRVMVAGADNDTRTVDGAIASARFMDPRAVSVGPGGRIVVAETSTSAIRLLDTQQGAVSTLAGGMGGGDVDGPAASARFNDPRGITAAADGTLYVADRRNHSVRSISATGALSTLARGFGLPLNVAARPLANTVYVATSAITTVFFAAVAPDGTLTGVGTGGNASTVGLAADVAGNLYFSTGSTVDVIAPGGATRVLASGIAVENLALDAAGLLYFTSARNTVGVIDASGIVTIRAGAAGEPGIADGIGIAARFGAPSALTVDPAGNMYVGDGTRIRKVTPEGVVTTIADVATVQGGQAGLTTTALGSVKGLAWSAGALYASVLNALVRIAPVN